MRGKIQICLRCGESKKLCKCDPNIRLMQVILEQVN